MVYVEDQVAWPTMVRLAACLCTTLEERGLPATCQCTVVPGPAAVLDRCGSCSKSDGCGGQGWVRFVNEFPSSDFPSPDVEGVSSCKAPMAYVLEVGVARCQPTGNANGISGYTAPSMESLVEATRLLLADKAAMLAAIQCCMEDEDHELTYTIGQYTTLQASGDCGGGMWTVTIWSV